jgi:hypothetical protein
VAASPSLAGTALMLLVTAALVPWWVLEWSLGGVLYERLGAFPFRSTAATRPWAPLASGLLLVAAAIPLFLRLAGKEWRYSLPAWRRALAISTLISAAACASLLAWPDGDPLWGTRTYETGGATVEQVSRPGIGWWVAFVALAASAAAWWTARREGSEE